MEIQLYQPVPLTYSRIQDGSEVGGLSVTVKVVNAETGATLLSSTAMSEVVSGQYEYLWNNSLTAPTHCKALYSESGQVFVEYFDIVNVVDVVEGNSGRIT